MKKKICAIMAVTMITTIILTGCNISISKGSADAPPVSFTVEESTPDASGE